MRFWAILRTRLLSAALAAALVFLALPVAWGMNSRLLVAWDVGVLVYLALAWVMAVSSSTHDMRQRADLEDEGAVVVLVLTLGSSLASLAAIAVELSGIHDDPPAQEVFRLTVAAVTILCTWFFVNTIYAIHYAHEYYADEGRRRGLQFPDEDKPDYWDFLYFAFTMGAAAQTSDVVVMSKRMRKLVLAHTILAFLFNTTVLALAVNVGAGLL